MVAFELGILYNELMLKENKTAILEIGCLSYLVSLLSLVRDPSNEDDTDFLVVLTGAIWNCAVDGLSDYYYYYYYIISFYHF